ncbi:hypothetical protein [Planococcus sp. ISL-110]|uniref:DUF7669 domain-containing protein n=1 Tax=Planococcus sp. ISL-110 TaxID=2819167 RepID=UPI001BEC7D06|nr:hypothetical protein [Planococcus sp. ISL-110]MBT2571787.1 hypothetical protein [Planococcus sp. ISL-110]
MAELKKIRTTARDEILATAKSMTKEREVKHFSVGEILKYMKEDGTSYKDSTIRTHITSKCCSNAPNHHATVFNDYERIGKGMYRLIL